MADNKRNDLLILLALRRGPLHGYAIAHHIQQLSEKLLRVEGGSLYAEWTVSPKNRRVRVSRLTRAGRGQVEREASPVGRLIEGLTRMMRPAES